MTVRQWCFEHSLSLAAGAGFMLSNVAFFWVEPGGHLYDFLNMIAGCFGGGLVMAILGRKFWEKDSDPTTPPKE